MDSGEILLVSKIHALVTTPCLQKEEMYLVELLKEEIEGSFVKFRRKHASICQIHHHPFTKACLLRFAVNILTFAIILAYTNT